MKDKGRSEMGEQTEGKRGEERSEAKEEDECRDDTYFLVPEQLVSLWLLQWGPEWRQHRLRLPAKQCVMAMVQPVEKKINI